MHDGLGFRYVCRECGYKTNRKIPFEGHMSSKHGGEKFKCDKCDYHATKQSLKLHTKSKHDGLRYPCGECGYKATQKQSLKSHIASKHGGAVELRLKDLTGQIFNDLLNEQENSSNPKPAKKFKEYCMKSKTHQKANQKNMSSGDWQALELMVKSMMEKSKNIVQRKNHASGTVRQEKAYICKICGKEGQGCHIKEHIRAKHGVEQSGTKNKNFTKKCKIIPEK